MSDDDKLEDRDLELIAVLLEAAIIECEGSQLASLRGEYARALRRVEHFRGPES